MFAPGAPGVSGRIPSAPIRVEWCIDAGLKAVAAKTVSFVSLLSPHPVMLHWGSALIEAFACHSDTEWSEAEE